MYNPDEEYLCYKCITDTFLSNEIRRKGCTAKCKYCKGRRKSYTLEKMADRVEQAFEQHYERTADQPSEDEYRAQFAEGSNYYFEREGETLPFLLEDAGGILHEAAYDIQHILDTRHYDHDTDFLEHEYSRDAQYELKQLSDDQWQKEWAEFEHTVKTGSRFFSKKVYAYLQKVFSGIEHFTSRMGRPLICTAGPGQALNELFRARVFQDEQELLTALKHPDLQIGTPASSHARAGRMNAAGIAVFYGATEAGLAMAEVRPPVGSWIVTARFDLIRPLRLLDLTALRGVRAEGSLFDPAYVSARQKAMFLRRLAFKFAQPVMPLQENLNYLTTQVIAEFLAEALEPAFDGIIYPSTQSGKDGANVVLFHRAARVERIPLPDSYRIDVNSRTYEPADDMEYVRYHVIVHDLGKPVEQQHIVNTLDLSYFGYNPAPAFDASADERMASLRIDEQNLLICGLRNAEFKTEPFSYTRSVIDEAERGLWRDELTDD